MTINSTNTANPIGLNKTKLKFLVLLILWAVAFIPVYPDLISKWFSHSNNSHGILVPFISAFLIWQKRNEIWQAPVSNSKLGAIILASSTGLYLLSYAGAVAVVSRAMIVLSLAGLVLFTLGKNIFSNIKFPIFYLLFMIPVPDSVYSLVAFPLQLIATKVSAFIIHTLSIPAYCEGNMLYFAQTQLEVAEACSGLRSLMAFIMLGFLFAYMIDKSWNKQIILVLSTIPLAFFANIVRVTSTGILANFFGEKLARSFLHEFSGLVIFAFGFILLSVEYLLLNKVSEKL